MERESSHLLRLEQTAQPTLKRRGFHSTSDAVETTNKKFKAMRISVDPGSSRSSRKS